MSLQALHGLEMRETSDVKQQIVKGQIVGLSFLTSLSLVEVFLVCFFFKMTKNLQN